MNRSAFFNPAEETGKVGPEALFMRNAYLRARRHCFKPINDLLKRIAYTLRELCDPAIGLLNGSKVSRFTDAVIFKNSNTHASNTWRDI